MDAVYTADRPGDAPDFQDAYTPHRTNVTAVDTQNYISMCSPGGYKSAPAVFSINKAQTVELRSFCSVNQTGKELTLRVYVWPTPRFDPVTATFTESAGYCVLDTTLDTSGQRVIGHPFGGDSTASGTSFFAIDAETSVYVVDGQVLTYPNTGANADGDELRYIIDAQGCAYMAVLVSALPATSRVEVGLRRVG